MNIIKRNSIYVSPFIVLFICAVGYAQTVTRIHDGVVITRSSGTLRLKACNDNIIRVMYTTGANLSNRRSLSVIDTFPDPPVFTLDTSGAVITLSLSKMRAEVTKSSGTIRFLGAENQLLLEEPATNGRYTSPVVRRSDTASHLWQKFVLNHGEALYGLGQHQNAPMNYRNSSLTLLQSNRVENGVPLLVSTNGYGIFWDNASETMFASGTATAFEGIAPTQLFTANGTTGGLTGEYYASNNFTNLVLTRDDKGIDFDWWKLSPAAGMPNDNYSIRWTGKILTEAAGTYTFRSLEDDGLRVWVNNTLLINDWATHPLTNKEGSISLAANTKYNITVEYFEATDKSLVRLEWKKPSSANTAFSFYSDIGDQIDYYMIYGPEIDQIVAGYQAVTGSVPLLPKWSYGFFQSRERYIDQNMVLTIANEFRTRKIPIDVIVQDWNYWTAWNSFIFDASRYPDPAGMIKWLHDTRKLHFMISIWPNFASGTSVYNELDKNGSLVKGLQSYFQDGILYDAFSASGGDIYWKHLYNGIFSKGVDALWVDASEPGVGGTDCSKDILNADAGYLGSISRNLNAYPLVHSQNLYTQWRASGTDKRVNILTRAGFAGQQHYATTVWTGDIKGDWPTYKKQIQALLNFSMAGMPYVATDIGGFFPMAKNTSTEYRELYTRWFQFGAFSPIFRSHGTGTEREMWFFGNPGTHYYDAQMLIDKLRYRLIPYIYSTAWRVTYEGYTLMRALAFDHRADKAVYNLDDEYLFGPAMLVAPIVTYQATSRSVYLPANTRWYNFWTGDTTAGGKSIIAQAPISIIPLFVKAGSIIPMGPYLEYVDQKSADPIELRVYTGKSGSFTLYEDEGDNYNYEKGSYAAIPLSWDETDQALTIGTRQGTFSGMLDQRDFHIVWVKANHGTGLDTTSRCDVKVTYNGTGIRITRAGVITASAAPCMNKMAHRSVTVAHKSISISAHENEPWTMNIFDLKGSLVYTLGGNGSRRFSASGSMAQGVYILTMKYLYDGAVIRHKVIN